MHNSNKPRNVDLPWRKLPLDIRAAWLRAGGDWLADAAHNGALWALLDRIGDFELTALVEQAIGGPEIKLASLLLPRIQEDIRSGRIEARDPALRPVAPLALAIAGDQDAIREIHIYDEMKDAHVYRISGPQARAVNAYYGGDPNRCKAILRQHLEIGRWYWGTSHFAPAAVWTGTEFATIEIRTPREKRYAFVGERVEVRYLSYYEGQHGNSFVPFYKYNGSDWFAPFARTKPIPSEQIAEGWYAGEYWVRYFWKGHFFGVSPTVVAAWSLPTDDVSGIAVPAWVPISSADFKPLLRLPAPQIIETDSKFSALARVVRYPFPPWPIEDRESKESDDSP